MNNNDKTDTAWKDQAMKELQQSAGTRRQEELEDEWLRVSELPSHEVADLSFEQALEMGHALQKLATAIQQPATASRWQSLSRETTRLPLREMGDQMLFYAFSLAKAQEQALDNETLAATAAYHEQMSAQRLEEQHDN